MASSRLDYLEVSRPPENPVKRRCSDNTRSNYKYYYKSSETRKLSMGALSLPSSVLLSASNGLTDPDIGDPNSNGGQLEKLTTSINSNSNSNNVATTSADEENNRQAENEQIDDVGACACDIASDVNFNQIRPGKNKEQCRTAVTSPKCVVKSNSCRETGADRVQASSFTKRPASLPPEQCSYRKRSSYHRDAEEALSSLLWQPYEYRTTGTEPFRSDSSDTLSSSLSSASSSCASLSLDSAARGMMQSFTDEFLNVTTSLPAQRHSGNNADPNLSSQMVSNLMALNSATVGVPIVQSGRAIWSRGRDGGSAASQVDWERSRECASALRSVSEYANVCSPTTTAATAIDPTVFSSCVRDDTAVVSSVPVVSDMRVEIPGPAGSQPPPVQDGGASAGGKKQPDVLQHGGVAAVTFPKSQQLMVPPNNVGQIDRSTQANHRQQNVLFHHQAPSGGGGAGAGVGGGVCVVAGGGGSVCGTEARAPYVQSVPGARCSVVSTAISSDMMPSNMTSVVSANVVGLPVHSRSSSNLSTSRADTVQPNHPRSISETANVFVHQPQQHMGNHFRSSSSVATATSQHQDRNSHCGLIPVPSHPRQGSCGSLQTRGASEPPINITHSSDVNKVSSDNRSSSLVPHHTSATALDVVQSGAYVRGSGEPTRTLCSEPQSKAAVKIEDVVQARVPPLPNVSNVNVNFYRAVPVNVVSSVPTIQCLNSVEETGNDVSNVHIVQAMPTSIPTVSVTEPTQVPVQQSSQPPSEVRTRTFTSTEAQTDDTAVGAMVSPTVVSPPSSTREQRRRERRERRHQRRLNSINHQHTQPQGQQWSPNSNDRLPDLLNSHLPPPYTTLPSSMPQNPVTTMVPPSNLMPNTVVTSPIVPSAMVPFHPGVVPGQVPLVPGAQPVPVPAPTGFRFPFPSAAGFRRCRSRLGPRYTEEQPKSCCGLLVSRPGSLRWFIALIALVAVCCVLVGTVLGAMRPAGRDHLTVSLLMIGVGIVLVTVSGVAWRLTSHDAPSCRAMLGLESSESADICTRRFVPRLPPSYGRPHHPYAAMIYPEFQYRPPPPSYQASMQEYRLRLLLLDRGTTPQIQNAQHAVSPPPTYRSHAGSLLRAPLSSRRDTTQSEYSCPPSYRSRSSSNRQAGNETIVHSREQSLSLSESNQDESVVNVVNILTNQEAEIALDNMTLDSLKVAPDNEHLTPLRMLLKSSSGNDLVESSTKDGNLVTIVQKEDQNPVIVTVSGSQMSTTNPEVGSSNQIPSEMEILAHL